MRHVHFRTAVGRCPHCGQLVTLAIFPALVQRALGRTKNAPKLGQVARHVSFALLGLRPCPGSGWTASETKA